MVKRKQEKDVSSHDGEDEVVEEFVEDVGNLDPDCIPPFEPDDDVFDNRLPERWFIRNRYPRGRKAHSYSKSDYLVELALALKNKEKVMDRIMKSQFAKLFNILLRSHAFSGQLVHTLLTRQLRCRRRHKVWFVFGGKPIKFSLRELCIVTGLKCDLYEKTASEAAQTGVDEAETEAVDLNARTNTIELTQDVPTHWDTLIGQSKEANIKQLIIRLQSEEEMDDETILQLALVIIVDGVVAVPNQYGNVIKETVEMVKDVDKFLEYPWGRKAFELTMTNFKGIVKKKNMEHRVEEQTLSMRGFC